MESKYKKLTCTRKEEVDGIGPWIWIKKDHGAWDGPKKDWETSHKQIWYDHIPQKRVVVQAGGCLGMYPKLLARDFKMVYTFEPDPLNFYCLVQNCQEDNIIKIQGALGDQRSFVNVNRISPENVGMNQVHGVGPVPQFRLDDFNFPLLDALILDVELYEPNAIVGAQQTLLTKRPTVIMELGHRPELEQMMTQLNYKMVAQSVADIVYVPNER